MTADRSLVERAGAMHTAGLLDEAEAIYRQLLADSPVDAVVTARLGGLSCQRGALRPGCSLLRRALSIMPALPEAQLNYGTALSQLNAPGAEAWMSRATAAQFDFAEAHTALAHTRWPGEDHYAFLHRLHEWLRPRRYLEIGVREGRSLALASPGILSVGVDPAPEIGVVLAPGTRIYRQRSDEFFADGHAREAFGGAAVDFAFIDGLHRFEQALRDFANVERLAHRGAVVALHDCLPLDSVTAAPEQTTRFYSGDVWKVVVCLKRHRPDLAIRTVGVPPTGLALIARLDPGSRVLADDFDTVVASGVDLDVREVMGRLTETFNLIPNDWAAVERHLRSVGVRPL